MTEKRSLILLSPSDKSARRAVRFFNQRGLSSTAGGSRCSLACATVLKYSLDRPVDVRRSLEKLAPAAQDRHLVLAFECGKTCDDMLTEHGSTRESLLRLGASLKSMKSDESGTPLIDSFEVLIVPTVRASSKVWEETKRQEDLRQKL
uniref:Uncharacterized protein n=1 Tax=Chromera velia CCMP2878 TaxID=1169474 RepID=A0A0G4I0J4_9ALVE|eukprot:Cvel_34361.t1-p1 / transcript=Cvel_34361.t1 / gene=Cvel_34361 / organism=Chromera_velia_CCMP2878 / gene_product=hypothetical protein / transcript_product=hypothetical protein / location=Cvel_scaffold5871:2803-3396(+) / protein_length=147 / sequence_SO=supercontig / SO=protein_coding / is_pseudo=false